MKRKLLCFRFEREIFDMAKIEKGPVLTGMAACHSLTVIDGELTGDPLEMIMFAATGWVSSCKASFLVDNIFVVFARKAFQ